MRPWGPEPLIDASSMPASRARRLASGEAKMRVPFCEAAGAAPVDAVGVWPGTTPYPFSPAAAWTFGCSGEGEGEAVGLAGAAGADPTAFASSPSPAITPITWFTG